MAPPKPVWRGPSPSDEGREVVRVAWLTKSVLCSQPARLMIESKGYDGQLAENLLVENAADGATEYVDTLRLKDGSATYDVLICDVIPRRIGGAQEHERAMMASVASQMTSEPIRLKFISDFPSYRYARGYRGFDISVADGELVIEKVFEFTLGWMFYVIKLGDAVEAGVGGHIDLSYRGSEDWRYCKRAGSGSEQLLYFDGGMWRLVPDTWSDDIGTKLYGFAVWRDGDAVKEQLGTRKWPDLVPGQWSTKTDEEVETALLHKAAAVDDFWTGKADIKRNECRGHDVACCRYGVRFRTNFKQVAVKARGIIIAENHARANAGVWPLDAQDRTFIHEFGHHMGNPDEYEGAATVDPSVNGDGAKAGIDKGSIMGSGDLVRRRHFDDVCKAMSQAVAQHLGESATYRAIEPL